MDQSFIEQKALERQLFISRRGHRGSPSSEEEGEGAKEMAGMDEVLGKEARKKIFLRFLNGGSAITLAGVAVAVLIMNSQLIIGNVLGYSFVPKLSILEIILILVIDFFLFIVVSYLFLMTVVLVMGPVELAKYFSSEFIRTILPFY